MCHDLDVAFVIVFLFRAAIACLVLSIYLFLAMLILSPFNALASVAIGSFLLLNPKLSDSDNCSGLRPLAVGQR